MPFINTIHNAYTQRFKYVSSTVFYWKLSQCANISLIMVYFALTLYIVGSKIVILDSKNNCHVVSCYEPYEAISECNIIGYIQ